MVTVLSCVTQPPAATVPVGTVVVNDILPFTMETSCEPIIVPLCQEMPYNGTRMPNLLAMTDQQEALLSLEQFRFLPDTNCSPYLVFFLCILYTPICTTELQIPLAAIPPCRQVCEHVKNNCESLVNKMGFVWPHMLDCRQFPDVNKGVCLTPEAILKKEDSVRKNPENCPCHRLPKLKQRLYYKRKFDYAIRGKIEWTETFGSLTLTSIFVDEVFKNNFVHIEPNSREILWTNTSCGTCPRLDIGREYFLLGHEDHDRERLLYTQLSVGLEWRKKYAMLVTKWEKAKKQTSNTGRN